MKHLIFSLFFFILCLCAEAQTQKTNLPTFYINTENSAPIVSKETYINGRLSIVSSVLSENLDSVIQIRGRGNSTWSSMPKKAYRIKLANKTRLLGLPAKEKDWVLLANYADKTLMRNAVAFEAGHFIGFDFTPTFRFVDVVLNGVFIGNYILTDQVEVGKKRVNIESSDTVPNITGGYFIEIDGFSDGEPVWFQTYKGLKVTVKYPDNEDISKAQLDYITNYVKHYEYVLFSTNFKDPKTGYRAITDTTSLINWYIASELTGNPDCFWSTYLYKKRDNDTLYFGPLWDFDIAFNNDNRLGDATRKLMREYAFDPKVWINRFFEDEWFVKAVDRRWKELQNQGVLNHLQSFIDSTETLLDASQKLNYQKYNVLNTRVYNEYVLFPTYAEGVDYLKSYLNNRVSYLNTNISNYEATNPTAFVAEDFYYMFLNKQTNNAIDVSESSMDENAGIVIWNPVDGKTSQCWKILSLGNDEFKIVNKNSGKSLQSVGYNENIVQALVDNTNNDQKWTISSLSDGVSYGVVNVGSGYAIDNSGGSYSNGNHVIEWTNEISSNVNQQWYIQKISKIETGINNLSNNLNLILYPGIVTEKAHLRFFMDESSDVTFSICNIAGVCVYKEVKRFVEAGEQTITIPVSSLNLSSGLYIVQISTDKGSKGTCKMLVK